MFVATVRKKAATRIGKNAPRVRKGEGARKNDPEVKVIDRAVGNIRKGAKRHERNETRAGAEKLTRKKSWQVRSMTSLLFGKNRQVQKNILLLLLKNLSLTNICGNPLQKIDLKVNH